MDNTLPDSNSILNLIASEEGFDKDVLNDIWISLPMGDSGDITYLESAGQCIISVSDLVDQKYPDLSQSQKTAYKFRLMGKLLLLKAAQLA